MNAKAKPFKRFILPAVAAILLALIAVGLLVYRGNLRTELQTASGDTLLNMLDQQRYTFASKLQDQKNALKIYAAFFEHADSLSSEELVEKLNFICENATFDYLSYAAPDGATIENTGARLNVADRDYFQRSMAGETVIANPVVSKVTGMDTINFSTPILRDGKPVAVLVCLYNADSLSKLLLPTFGGQGHTYVTTSDGAVIFKTGSGGNLALYSNLFAALDAVQLQEPGSAAIKADVAAGNSGHARYSQGRDVRILYYAPVEINDWYVFISASDLAITPRSTGIMDTTTLLVCIVASLFAAALLYVFASQRSHLRKLGRAAFVDSLTGAANRKQFKLTAAALLADKYCRYAFAILDIDKFKVLNDKLGYACGDQVLIGIARILRANVKANECFCRCDSDEFFLLLGYEDHQSFHMRLQAIMIQIQMEFKEHISAGYGLVLCAGVYVITDSGESVNSISDKARHAHLLIKGKDESDISFYNDQIRTRILAEKEIENKMHAALDNREFLLYLQPKYYLESEQMYGAEALVRWDSGNANLIYPNDFIPIFERTGFIAKLDMYMLEKACLAIRNWIDAGIAPIPISINFSRLHLKNLHFVDDIAAVVEQYRVPTHLIEIELTESTMLHNEVVLIDMLTHLHEHGFTLSMDDFGSGYSSLGLLKNLPVDVIKLDKTFFADFSEQDRAVIVVASIISMAKKLGIKTVAEGVETKAQIAFLKELGCDIVQGYYYARPMAAAELTQFLEKDTATV